MCDNVCSEDLRDPVVVEVGDANHSPVFELAEIVLHEVLQLLCVPVRLGAFLGDPAEEDQVYTMCRSVVAAVVGTLERLVARVGAGVSVEAATLCRSVVAAVVGTLERLFVVVVRACLARFTLCSVLYPHPSTAHTNLPLHPSHAFRNLPL